ncbi:MAG: histidine kinase, partial [Bacteroidota bacterium]
LYLLYDYLILTITTAYTSLFYFAEKWFKNISAENQLRNEKLQAEVNFLKSQINPHFLFNTLNNIYSYTQTGNEKAAPMLERLSSILRFMVYDCAENRVGLSKEITAIESLLEIHKMKNSAQQNIDLSVEGVRGFHLIAPLIIVNFVENACKHSDVVSNKNGFIKVKVWVDEADHCLLTISNSYKEKKRITNPYGGLGLENIKKRLALQYGDRYRLSEEKADGIYQLQLHIPLERKQ